MPARTDWIATDLDGTLFHRDHTPEAVAGTWRLDGNGNEQPSSWMPRARHTLVAGLATLFRVVPVTARDIASFSRVRIEGIPLKDGAILANGAILLLPGTMLPDPAWDAEIGPALAEWTAPLLEMAARLSEASAGTVVPRLVESNTPHPAYLVAKAMDGYWSQADGLRLREVLSPFRCRVAELGRELQVLPPPVGKRLGVQAFARAHCAGASPLLTLGDMPEDLGFMQEGEFVAAPVESTLGREWGKVLSARC